MTPEENTLISGLFDRLRKADTSPKDREAEQLIQSRVGELPSAPYLLAQTVLVQEHALASAQARIQQLERQVAAGSQAQTQTGSGGGSFLSGLFGGSHPQQVPAPASAPVPQAPPYPSTVNMAPSVGGGFLKTALAAAAGVAGGSLLFQGIEGLLGHNAGPFGSSFGGGGLGGFGGSNFLGGGGRPEVIENNEVVNNYYGDGGGGNDLGAQQTAGTGLFDNSSATDDQPFAQDADYSTPPVDQPDYAPDDFSNSGDSSTDDFSGGGDDFSGSGGDDSSLV